MRLIFLLALLLAPVRLAAQQPRVFIADSVRAKLAARWDDSTQKQNERGYCIQYFAFHNSSGKLLYYKVDGVQPGIEVDPTPYQVYLFCPKEAHTTTVHTHPPTSCTEDGTCWLGGDDAYNCLPSAMDVRRVQQYEQPFALLQCDAKALVPYFNPEWSWTPPRERDVLRNQ